MLKTVKVSKKGIHRFSLKEKARSLYEEGKEAWMNAEDGVAHARAQIHGNAEEKTEKMYTQGNQSGISSINPDESGGREGSEMGDSDGESVMSSFIAKELSPNGKPVNGKPLNGKERGVFGALKNLSPAKAKMFFKKKLGKVTDQPMASSSSSRLARKSKEERYPSATDKGPHSLHGGNLLPAVKAPTPQFEEGLVGSSEDGGLKSTNPHPSFLRERGHLPSKSMSNSHSATELLPPSKINSLPPSPPLHSNASSEVVGNRIDSNSDTDAKGNGNATEGEALVRAKSDTGVYDSSSKQRVPSWCVTSTLR